MTEPARQPLAFPRGTITFLFTDVEGSTSAWLREPVAMGPALARHDALIEQLVAEHAGHVVRPRGEGDSRFAVFARASDAVGRMRDAARTDGRSLAASRATAGTDRGAHR